jgi:hypothetical protein
MPPSRRSCIRALFPYHGAKTDLSLAWLMSGNGFCHRGVFNYVFAVSRLLM